MQAKANRPISRRIISGLDLLSVKEMSRADGLAVAAGISSLELMENAGRAVAEEVVRRWPQAERVAVLCGPGNNGGDGYVAARRLRDHGYVVRVGSLVAADALEGDAAEMARRWTGDVMAATAGDWRDADVVVDALFGAGLSRNLAGDAARVVNALRASGLPVVAVDVPSGIHGDTGAIMGAAVRAVATVTFFRLKPGHLLLPGRRHCGEVALAQIGIPDGVLEEIDPRAWRNAPALWLEHFPWPAIEGHKYDRGHAVVVSGPAERTGAARLGAQGALRIGAGVVTVASSEKALPVNAAHLTAIMLARAEGAAGLSELLSDKRKNSVLIGPGAGIGARTRDEVQAVLRSGAAATLDADALTSFEEQPEELFAALRSREGLAAMTPHHGEFERLFPDLVALPKLERTRAAARRATAVVALKGPDTVVASPDGRAAIADNGPAWLATAGSGDVLAGFVAGLLAQTMPVFEAACAAVWLHGAAASEFGPGLIAEDLPEALPALLRRLKIEAGQSSP